MLLNSLCSLIKYHLEPSDLAVVSSQGADTVNFGEGVYPGAGYADFSLDRIASLVRFALPLLNI